MSEGFKMENLESQKPSEKPIMQPTAARSLTAFPAEIHLAILENLPRQDREALSVCSKYYRDLCLPFLFKHVVINQDDPSIFMEGGSLEHIRRYTKSIRLIWLSFKWGSQQDVIDNLGDAHLCLGDSDLEEVYSDLRMKMNVLKLFPSLRALHVLLGVLYSTEKAVYSVFLKAIADSGFRDTLEELELRIESKSDTMGRSRDEIYKASYLTLSKENQEFLGGMIPSGYTLKSFKNMTPDLPVLKKVTLSIYNLPQPTDDPGSKPFTDFGYYYHLLTSAPELRKLYVNTLIIPGPNSPFEMGIELHPDLLRVFSKIKTLHLKTFHFFKDRDIRRLTERFPNVEYLDIRPHSRFNLGIWEFCNSSFDGISNLKRLRKLILPWIIIPGLGSLKPYELIALCNTWKAEGFDCLETLTFVGKRLSGERYEDVRIRLEIVMMQDEGRGGNTELGHKKWNIRDFIEVDGVREYRPLDRWSRPNV
ncbi:hypothetical protein TWF225_008812 [Orbilia oligospora]|nr:hypothetical protein TWF225_008812 [Orbilia oligospora]KAF3254614.1 hypothetical protein TWF217_006830 [Orbilia oligospora]KAF3259236.1 hypothetical protein TWF128_004321 [Orbilia oligospora]KAF3282543.1 hypothetical protein TWF132_010674 [Orbilia oligospora]